LQVVNHSLVVGQSDKAEVVLIGRIVCQAGGQAENRRPKQKWHNEEQIKVQAESLGSGWTYANFSTHSNTSASYICM
jgi:hypothetical protein